MSARPREAARRALDLGRRRLPGRTRGAKAEAAREPSASPFAGTGTRVLLVDDEEPLRVVCRLNLELAGLEVTEAADGEQALAAIAAERPDIILLDVMMPRLDGWEVAAQLAADETTRELPIVFLSARTAPEDRRRAVDAGGIGYIVKPFDPLALPGRLQTMLERMRRGERDALRREALEGL